MTTYKTTLDYCLRAYPTSFSNEKEVLHHIFFVNGNGYEWKKGQIHYRLSSRESSLKEHEKRHLEEFGTTDPDKIREIYREKHPFSSLCEEEEEKRKLYPICEYAKIANIPDDIKNDWLLAAKKAIDIANSEFITTKSDQKWLAKASKRISEIEELRQKSK